MGKSPNQAMILASGLGNSTDGTVSYNTIDSYFGVMAAKLLILLRAENVPILMNSTFVDALGNPVQNATTNAGKGHNSSFNNYETITLVNSGSNIENPLATQAGLLGTTTPPVAMTDSFTILTGARQQTSLSFAQNGLYGDSVGTSDSVNASGISTNLSGALTVKIGGTTASLGTIPPTNTSVIWVSYDAATGIWRTGLNSPAIAATATIPTGTVSRNGNGVGAICYPFGYGVTGDCGQWQFHRWALFNKAYMNGSVPSDDAQFSALVNAYVPMIGA